jgi:DNA replication protein DnaC
MSQLLQRLHEALTTLQLAEVDALLENHLEQAVQQESTYADFLCPLLEAEVDARRTRLHASRMRMAGFPSVKTLSQFDFSFQPSIDERQVRELATLRFASEANNVILLGPPGVGKTHLAIALAVAAIGGGNSAYFVTAHDLVTDLGSAAREGKLENRLRHYLKPKVLVVDEVGYLPLDTVGATIFFQLVSARYERGSILLTSNKSYADWGQVFGETTIATAILDRLLHHSTTINIRGESYRLKERKKAGLLSSPVKSEASSRQG